MRIQTLLLTLFCGLMGSINERASAQESTSVPTAMRWFKGNTHTHTNNSDGDSPPDVVAKWYRNNGYDFLMLTDHNKRTEVDEIQQEIDALNAEEQRKPFLLIPGEEVTSSAPAPDPGRNFPIHTCGLNTETTVGEQKSTTKQATLQQQIDAIRKAGGTPSVNHPNFGWALTPEDLGAMSKLRHFEIYNGHPTVNNLGGGGVPSCEGIWDILLSRGMRLYGVAVDDAHNFKRFARDVSNPGRGWVVVRAKDLTPTAIMQGLNDGDFYASTGVMLEDVATSGTGTLTLTIAAKGTAKFQTEFIGKDGKVLKTDDSMEPAYQLQPEDLYVRARVTSSNGDLAWTQPLFR